MTATLNIPAQITSVYDGDTLKVRIVIDANLRLIDVWAPELNEPGGIRARDELIRLAVGQEAVLSIPVGSANDLGDLFSFGRVLGDATVVGQVRSLAEQMITAGLASTTKNGRLGE